MQFFGHLGEITNPESFFREQEYIVCRGALEHELIDNVLDLYESQIVPSRHKYQRQSTHWEPNQLTPAGGVVNCLLNPHSYQEALNGRFSDRILKLVSTPAVRKTLALISEKPVDFTLHQTMMFDHATTGPHQDWIYLDSRPNGHLIAGWMALEDIHAEGIRFFVYPGTHHFLPRANLITNAVDYTAQHLELISEIQKYLDTKKPEMYAPPLRKGDIFFWGSRIIHGSTPGADPTLRRRSIAAHFVPDGFKFGNFFGEISVQNLERYGLRYTYHDMDSGFKLNNGIGGFVRRVAGRVARRLE